MPETLPEEMKGLQSIVDQAKDFDIAVYRELKKSQFLVEQGFYTEASLRLGRAVEACIYSTARQLGVSVSMIFPVSEQLDKIVNEIEAAQISIAQQQTKEGIKKLLECMKKLASAIDGAVEDISKPSNSESLEKPFPNREKPFPNQALYKSFQAKVGKLPDSSTFDKNALIKRLNNEQSQLANLSKIRNKSAHANLKGEENEVNREEYIDLANKVSTVIDTLFIVKLNMQSL
jgi:hypothetical protein